MTAPDRAEEPVEILALRIERDICALFHRYAHDAEMFEFATLYTLPYWDYLDFPEVGPRRRSFICEGCLMLILRLARECPHDPDPEHRRTLGLCRAAIERAEFGTDRPRRLGQFALLLIAAAERGGAIKESECDELAALENDILREYFTRMARQVGEASPPPATEVSLARYRALADQAYRQMLAAASGTAATAAYSEAKASLAEAVALARAMEMPGCVAELEQQLERTRTVFRQRFA